MPNGYTGKILRVNLSSGSITTETPPDNFYRHYLGGEGLIAYFLLKEVPKGVDPLGPQNKLIFAAGPITGAPVGGSGRNSIGAKSPLTEGFGEADAGGYWGAELKMAGFDAIIIEGKAEKPVYLFIQDGEAKIKDASHLWGMKTLECQNAIRQELGDSLIKVAQIGPAGENLVRFACVVNDLDAFAGRTGLGAVMGSKKLKAVACRGRQRLSLANKEAVAEIARWIRDNTPVNANYLRDHGTAGNVSAFSKDGGLPTNNFQQGSFADADKITGRLMTETILVKRRGCFACPIQCKREVKVDEPFIVDPQYGGPEYETIAAIGSNCGVGDLKTVAKGSEMTAAYGVDSISCGMAISFAMECFERGLLTKKDTGELDLKFGNGAAMMEMIERIALRKGLGDVLAEGVVRASKKLGKATEEFALHVKGQELPMHEPRWKQGLGMGFVMSQTGADHCHNMHDTAYSSSASKMLRQLNALGVIEPLPITDLSPAKMRLLIYHSLWQHLMNCTVCCYFVMVYGLVGFQRVTDLLNAVTGWNTTVFELMKVAERSVNLSRVFNVREGFTAQDDNLPKRFFSPQLPGGPLKDIAVDAKAFQKAKETYYDMMGWPNGIPSPAKLGELGIDWAVPLLL
ncbi:MAG: aldehyde ferredoxin oxidoreductase family protein [Chloroflexota bacterium]